MWRFRLRPVASPQPPRSSLTVAVASGRSAGVSRALARLGAPVTARAGSLLQVRDAPGLADRVQRLPGVRGVGPAEVPVPDQVISQGVERIGADALQSHGLTGAGIRIAIVDLGFGPSWRSLLGKELPPLTQIDATMSFDHTSGKPDIEGLSNADEPTGHGANVAQVVWDIAPGARYTFVNYHTQLELSQAVDWLVNGPDGKPRVDIVVHSNSFLDGPFDGTGVAAQAVDRAHDAGIFWANSAGNYARRHWEGVAGDADKDGWADIGPSGRGYLSFPLTAEHRHGRDALLEQVHEGRRRRLGLERELPARCHGHRAELARRVRAGPEGRLAAGQRGRLAADGERDVRPARPAADSGGRLQPRDLRRRSGAR